MADPVVVPTGQTFERAVMEASMELNYIPPTISSSADSFASFALNPNLAVKDAILDWCNDNGHPHPLPVSQEAARQLIRRLKGTKDDERREDSDQEPLSDAKASGSLQSGLPGRETEDRATTSSSSSPSAADPLEKFILTNLKSAIISEQESALSILLPVIRKSRDRGISLCNQRIVAAIIDMLQSTDSTAQINASGAMLGFAIIEANRIKIVSWGAVPSLVHVLSNGTCRARANAACAIWRLAMEERNRMVIGDLGAIPPLLEKFCEYFMSHAGREEAALALYYLSLCPTNLKILANMGAVPQLLAAATDKRSEETTELRKYAIMLLDCLAGARKGREDLMDMGVVEALVRLLREGGLHRYCLSVMYKISMHSSLRFKGLAVAAGAEEVLAAANQEWGQEFRETARRVLEFIREDPRKSKGKRILKKPYRPFLSDVKEVIEEEETEDDQQDK